MARTQLAESMKVIAAQSVWPRSLLLRVVAAIWALPVALLGCAGVMAFVLLGWARPVISEGALDVVATGPFVLWMADRHWGAFTFASALAMTRVCSREMVHRRVIGSGLLGPGGGRQPSARKSASASARQRRT